MEHRCRFGDDYCIFVELQRLGASGCDRFFLEHRIDGIGEHRNRSRGGPSF